MRLSCSFVVAAIILAAAAPAQAQVVLATYEFNNTYAADQPGVVALNPYAPGTAALSFATDTVNVGSQSLTRTVLVRGGVAQSTSTNQAGVELTTTSLFTNPNVYSAEMVFSMNAVNGFQRVLNSNDASDNGLYSTNASLMQLYPGPAGSHAFAYGPSTYHHVVLTNDGTTAFEYLDGVLDAAYNPGANSSIMNNPNNLLRFFLDNSTGIAPSDYGPGRVALVRLYDQVLTGSQVATLAANPFPVPEPGSMILCGATAVGGLIAARRRRPSANSPAV